VAGAATLLYTAPLIVAVLGHALLREKLTPARVSLALLVLVGVFFTVRGGEGVGALFESREAGLVAGVTGGFLAAVAYAGTTLLARWAVPRYGSSRVLFLELAGGTALLAVFLISIGQPPAPPDTLNGWVYVGLLSLGAVLGANYLFFGALKRIEAAPAAVAATIEPVIATLLAFAIFGQALSPSGWGGLLLVVAAVAAGYLIEAGKVDVPEAD
jgi:DME family drug/metabolite transporter